MMPIAKVVIVKISWMAKTELFPWPFACVNFPHQEIGIIAPPIGVNFLLFLRFDG